MHRLRTLSWLVICSAIFSTVAPALPAYAASPAAVTSPLRQKAVADHIADIRKGDPDLEDDFSSDASLFDTSYDGTTSAYMKSGELRISVDEQNTLAWSTLKQDVADIYLEVDTTQDEGSLDNQYGILARMDENGNYYLFAASSDGYYTIQARVDDEWTPLVDWTETDVINQGEGGENTIGLLAEGDTFTMLINDVIVDDVKDNSVEGKSIALNAAAFGDPPVEMGFDNFRLWYVGEPAETTIRKAPVDARDITPEAPVTGEATQEATEEATVEPTKESTPEPTEVATEEATVEPTEEATVEPTEEATVEPTEAATEEPTAEPTAKPTDESQGTSADPTIAAIQAQPASFSDDFKDGDGSDWTPYESDSVDYDVADGALQLTFNAPNVLTWSQPPISPTNFYIEADATVASGVEEAEYGIIFNYIDSQNFTLFAINNASRFSVWRLVNNSWETVADWADSSALQSGEGNTNRLGLLAQDNHIILTANDEVLADLDNDEAASGAVALAAGTFDESDLTMQFDNVKFWDLDAQGPQPTEVATEEATGEATVEPTEEATAEPTGGPTEEAQDFSEVTAHIADITANEPDIIDDFRRDTGVWDTSTDEFGSSTYANRAFNIEAHAEDRIIWSATYETADAKEPLQFDDFYAEFDTTFITYTGENAAGLVFRLVDNDNFYKFLVDESGYFQLQKRLNGDYSDVIEWALTDAEDTSEGAVNKIGILAEGSTLSFSVNGTVIAQAEDSDLTSGAIALAIQTYSSPEGHSTFDNFKLWQVNQ